MHPVQHSYHSFMIHLQLIGTSHSQRLGLYKEGQEYFNPCIALGNGIFLVTKYNSNLK